MKDSRFYCVKPSPNMKNLAVSDFVILSALLLMLRVGCDGVLGSRVKLDKCGVCGGDGMSCHAVSGIFTRRNLPYGYSPVASVPRGACNINITELMPSKNYLALKYTDGPYIINGNWKLVHSKAYKAAGTTFKYKRPGPSDYNSAREYIIAKGPTNQSLEIMILRQEVNHGITYSYTIPATKSSPPASTPEELKPKHIPLPELPPDKDEHHAAEGGVPAPSDQAVQEQQYNSFNAEKLRTQNQRVTDTQSNNRYPQTKSSQNPNSDLTHYYRTSQFVGNSYTNSQLSVSTNPGYKYAINPYRNGGSITQGNQAHQHRLRHQRNRNSRSRRHQVVVQSSPERRYDLQAQGGSPTGYLTPNANQPHIISALTPEGQRRYQYASQRTQSGSYSNQGVYPNPGQYIQPLQGQVGYNPNLGVQGPPLPAQQYGSYYPTINRGSYSDPITLGRAPLNDQISLTLPDSRTNQIGNVDTGNDYSWRISGFTDCTHTCGGGTQTTVIVCVKGDSQAIVTDENCDNALKPAVQTITCNNSPCPPAWEPTEWSRCSTSCDPGTKTRQISCKQRVSNSLILDVRDNLCRDAPRPSTVDTCNTDKPCVRWRVGNWSQCSVTCDRGQRMREVVCVTVDNIPIAENKCQGEKPIDSELCDMGSCAKTWFYTRWSEQCSTDCGEGVHKRQLYCSASEDKCNQMHKPHYEKMCKNQLPCGGKWFTGPWQKCSATCGFGHIERDVLCVKKLGRAMAIVGEENCVKEEKPDNRRECQERPCRPQWYMSDWSKCSKSCETGLKTREIKCMDENQQPSTLCPLEEKPETRRTCNTMPCPTHVPDVAAGCSDRFKNCRLVVQARLCSYDYYKSICCLSCAGHYEDH